MAMSVFGRAKRTLQPLTPARVAWNNPLLAGGTVVAMVVGSQSERNLATNRLNTRNGAVSRFGRPQGVGIYQSGNVGDLAVPCDAIGGSIYVEVWHGLYYGGGSSTANAYIFGCYTGSTGTGLAGKHTGIGNRWGYFDGGAINDSGEALVGGTLQTFVVVRDTIAGTAKVYRNGVLKIAATTGIPSPTSNFAVGSIGSNQFSTFGCESATFLAMRLRFKSWNDVQVREFTRNPWQLLDTGVSHPELYAIATGGGGPTNTTMVGTTGSFVLTGASASLVKASRMSAAPSTFSLTGTAATLNVAHRMPADAGSMTLAGSAVALRATRRMSAAAGTMALTGSAANFYTTLRLSTALGTFTIVGQPAAMYRSYRLPAAPATLSLTGSSTALVKASRAAAAPGSMALAGQPAALSRTRRLLAEAGTLSMSGKVVTLIYTPLPGNIIMPAGIGALTLTSAAAALRATRKMLAAAGTLVLTNTSATLSVSRRIAAVPGTLTLTGNAAAFVYTSIVPSYTMAAVAGSMSMVAGSVGLRAQRRITADAGVLSITGNAVLFRTGATTPGGPLSPEDIESIANAVWAHPRAAHVLTVADFLALK